jgi:acyl carrier protein
MDREQLFEKVKGIIVDKMGVDPSKVTMESNLRNDLKADSLDLVELLMAFQDDLGAKIDDKEAEEINKKIQTVGDAVEFLMTRL